MTAKCYETAWNKYLSWCVSLGELPLPVTEEKAIGYVVMLVCKEMQAATVKYSICNYFGCDGAERYCLWPLCCNTKVSKQIRAPSFSLGQ